MLRTKSGGIDRCQEERTNDEIPLTSAWAPSDAASLARAALGSSGTEAAMSANCAGVNTTGGMSGSGTKR